MIKGYFTIFVNLNFFELCAQVDICRLNLLFPFAILLDKPRFAINTFIY